MTTKVSQLPPVYPHPCGLPPIYPHPQEAIPQNHKGSKLIKIKGPTRKSLCQQILQIEKYLVDRIRGSYIINEIAAQPVQTAPKEKLVTKINSKYARSCCATSAKIDSLCIFQHQDPSGAQAKKIGDSIDFLQELEIKFMNHRELCERAWKSPKTLVFQNCPRDVNELQYENFFRKDNPPYTI